MAKADVKERIRNFSSKYSDSATLPFCFDPVILEFCKKYCCIIGHEEQVLGARLRGAGVFRRAAPSIFN